MDNKMTTVKAVFSAFFASLAIYFNALFIPVTVLTFFMICDYITGMINAYISHTLNSKMGLRGVLKKLSYFFAVSAAIGIDWIISAVNISSEGYTVSIIVTVWLIINEIISILENIKKIGVPVPKFIYKVIKHIKETTEIK